MQARHPMHRVLSWIIAFSAIRRPPSGGRRTRNALNSGIIVLASPTCGVSTLALSPFARPSQPQCHGTPTWWMIRPVTQNGSKRSVTRA